MLNRSQQKHDDRGDNRERSTSARQAAEALFTLKPNLIEPSVREMAPAGEGVRKPRVLAVTMPGLVQHDEPEAPINVKPPVMPVIPTAQVARVRALMKYGMTVAQVAEVMESPSARSSVFSTPPDDGSASSMHRPTRRGVYPH